MSEKKVLCFLISGEWATSFARDRFYKEAADYEWCEDFLLSCMEGSDIDTEVLKGYAKDILEGRRRLAGHTARFPDDPEADYHLEDDNVPELFNGVERELNRRRERELERQSEIEAEVRAQRRYASNLMMVNSFLENAKLEKTFGPSYGWLEPDGTFHEVEWAEHQEWARKYLEEEERRTNKEMTKDAFFFPGDELANRGWFLLHSPSQGIPQIASSEIIRLTKKQKEFLFDYYTDRGLNAIASSLYKDD